MVLRLFGIGEDRSWTYAMMSSSFPSDMVIGGSAAWACRLELVVQFFFRHGHSRTLRLNSMHM